MTGSKYLYLLSIFFLSCFLFNCSSDKTESPTNPTENYPVSLSDVKEEHLLNDDLKLLGSIGNVIFLDKTKWILMDNSPGVYLFENHQMTAKYGETGKGPCEFEEISAIDANSKKLYVLDASQTKIITFDINTQECIGELDQEHLRGAYYLHKEESKPSFIIANTSYTMMTPDSTSIVYRIFDNENSEALDVTLNQLDAIKTIFSMRSNTLGFAEFDSNLYPYFPLTDRLYSIDLNDYSIELIPLQIDLKREEIKDAGSNVDKILEIIQGDFDFVSKVLVNKNWIAVMINSRAARENEAPEMSLQFYDHEGTFIQELPIESKAMGIWENTLIFNKENTDPSADFTHRIEYRDVIIDKQ